MGKWRVRYCLSYTQKNFSAFIMQNKMQKKNVHCVKFFSLRLYFGGGILFYPFKRAERLLILKQVPSLVCFT